MKRIITILLFLLLYIGGQGQTLSPKVTPTTGGYFSGGGNTLSWTMGETHTVILQNGNILTQGEQQPEIDLLTGSISGSPFCSGIYLSVPYTAIGYYGGANVFTAQLSNSSGSFTSPVNIGTLTSTGSGNISVTIPSNSPSGIGYRIRVISSAPSFTGKDNGSNLSVNNAPIQPGEISGNTNICAGSVQIYSITAVTDATSYTWILPNGWSGTSTTTSLTTTAGSSGGTITVTANNACGNSTERALNVTIGNTGPAEPGAISGNTTVCHNTEQTYTIAAVAGATSYTWTKPSGWSGTSTSVSISLTAGSSGGNITVTASNSCGSSVARTLAVTVGNAPPAEPVSITGNTSVCQGTSQTYSVSPVSGASSYSWTKPSGWSGTSTINSITFTVNSISGAVTVKAVNSCGSSATRSLSVVAHAVTAVTITGNPVNCNFCSQLSPTSVILDASSGYTTYLWSPSGGNSQTATVSSANTYTVIAINASGCTTSAAKVVTNNCALPSGFSTTNIIGHSAKGNWISSQCAVNYIVRISIHGLNSWTSYTVTGNSKSFTGLSLNTTYDWQIKTNCNTSGSVNSGFSASQTFTTASQRMADEENADAAFNIYPNPANAAVAISFSTMEEGAYNIKLIDMKGRVVKSEIVNAGLGDNTYIMNLDGIAKGIYMVFLQKGDNIFKGKLIIE